jgi:hypothetical protein
MVKKEEILILDDESSRMASFMFQRWAQIAESFDEIDGNVM